MREQFKKHLDKFIKISDDEFADITGYFEQQTLKKKENVLTEGQICKASYFVLDGILRKFFINEKGVQQTTEFAIENWWMTETFSYINQTATEFYIQAVLPTEVLVIRQHALDDLLEKHPVMEKYFRMVYQKAYAAAQMRVKLLYEHSREELYRQFLKNQPAFLQRVPQYLVASYLGFTPEYLSEIRKKNFS
ncbi:cyclic nucleotide-binding protein [Sphingobacterium sp. CZ-UAM]|uniref:CRP-like cAMP-binding protein n=2 Tax=Sphingobacteriaceae TaxID=84566 RepID=A0A562N138_9SPHI|nr:MULTISPECIES: Crp/Fnr family transcriptional regulator [Sphingobacterium]MCW8312041.1 Crp/Fnr family transcriptional regulator [Sphingobacterium sp. InxBP1]OOG19302.1 cyclic nucleotide-binding protein [Sphingobacterium sp. CZ-UAM]TWI25846.1 CRP-like cAMP-binding protein [Sphingobacterium siyangense]